jgi:cytochrome c peroxidase
MQKIKVIAILLLFICSALCFTHITHKVKLLPFIVPINWQSPKYNFTQNPLTQQGIDLGRVLFYDATLSGDSSTSCASCHQQYAAFSTYDHSLSHGIGNMLTTRNATALQNLAWQNSFMADGSIAVLDSQPTHPFAQPNEMAISPTELIKRINSNKIYKKLYFDAFGNRTISLQKINNALTQFMLQLVSSNSKYDKVMQGKDSFLLPEKLGYEIFKNKCASCHKEPLFTDYSFRNIGLPLINNTIDVGRMRVTNLAKDSLKYRVPSLRNVAITKPYGHDGRFASIYNVFEHYRKNMIIMPNTDSLLQKKLPLSNFEIGQLTAFLYTLTDSIFIENKNFAPKGFNIIPAFRDLH